MLVKKDIIERLLYVLLILLFTINIGSAVLMIRLNEKKNIEIMLVRQDIQQGQTNRDNQLAEIQRGQVFLLCTLTAIAKEQRVNQVDINNCVKQNN